MNGGKQGTEPQKYRFVKNFQRGLELLGQHLFSVKQDQIRERLQGLGLPIVAGPNDVLRLWSLRLPSVALCSPEYKVSEAQAGKIADIAHDVAAGIVWLLLPCNPQGEVGMKQCLWYLSQHMSVRLGWNQMKFGGQYQGKEAEHLEEGSLIEIEGSARSGRRTWTNP